MMISVVDLGIGAHEPNARMVAVAFSSIAVIPLTIELYQKPEVDFTVKFGITVNTHILDACDIKKHLAAGIVNIAVTAVPCKSSVCGMFVVTRAPKESERQGVVDPVENGSGGLDFIISVKA